MKIKQLLLAFEFILLFFGVPILIISDSRIIHPSAVILPLLLLIFIYLGRNPSFRFRDLVRFGINKHDLIKHGAVITVVSGLMLLSVMIFTPENLFNLPKANPLVYLLICTFYPVFSAYGQEIIYRVFLTYRYKEIFRSDLGLILASSVAFSFVHIIYFSYVSVILTFFLGIYLSYVYLKTRSVLFSSIIHGILGDVVFTVGLGSYFWIDMFKWI